MKIEEEQLRNSIFSIREQKIIYDRKITQSVDL